MPICAIEAQLDSYRNANQMRKGDRQGDLTNARWTGKKRRFEEGSVIVSRPRSWKMQFRLIII